MFIGDTLQVLVATQLSWIHIIQYNTINANKIEYQYNDM